MKVPCRLLALSLALCVVAPGVASQPRSQPSGVEGLTVRQSVGVSPAAARREAQRHGPAVRACMEAAWRRDAAAMGALRRVVATVRLRAAGDAEVVALDPPLRTRGLSQCLAEALLGWQQSGPVRPGAWVALAVPLR